MTGRISLVLGVVAIALWFAFPLVAPIDALRFPLICSLGPLGCDVSSACAPLCDPNLPGVPVRDTLALLSFGLLSLSASLDKRNK